MIVDTSAIIAIALREDSARAILTELSRVDAVRVSAANLLEAWMVLDRRDNPEAIRLTEGILQRFAIQVEPVTEAQVSRARDAWRRFGKGSGHRAQLNFGDCFAYALAKDLNEPLLFIGNDFVHTDLP